MEILEPMGYFEVPASMTFHGAWPGGLFEHSWTVAQELVHMTKTLGLTWQMRRSPVLVGMFHDLCKTEEYEKDGDGWKHYKLKGHGERSVSMAEAILNDAAALSLTEEEMLCIRWHMGFADDKENWNCYGAAIEKYQNVLGRTRRTWWQAGCWGCDRWKMQGSKRRKMRRAGTAGWPGMCTDILRAGCMWCRAWPCIARRRNCL